MTRTREQAPALTGLWTIVGLLAGVEVASGVLQGYYTPVFSDIADSLRISDGDVNWFEAAQLIVAALVVPLLARLGDLWGHRNVLLLSTAVTALGSWVMAFAPGFTTFLVGSALQGAYVVWLPLEVAIVYRRTAGHPQQGRLTRKAAACLVAALELGVIAGALTSGALVEATSMRVLLSLPAVVVTLALAVIWFGVEHRPGQSSGGIDWPGLGLVSTVLGLLMGGLVVVRLQGPGSALAWSLVLLGLAAVVPLVRVEAAAAEPLIDVRLLATPGQWPIQLTALLFGVSVLGAQIPLSTFARSDPAVTGYGLGADAGFVSTLIGLYVVSLVVGALSLPLAARLLGDRGALVGACVLVAAGYALWLPFHDTTGQALLNMAVVGLGSGALVAALPAAAAAAAPASRTCFATGMTNAVKTVGGAVASAVFAIALSSTGSIDDPSAGSAPLGGYLAVWLICSGTALLAAVALLLSRPAQLHRPTASQAPV